jgi:hypothetical protein
VSEPTNTATVSTGWPKSGRTFRLVVRALPSDRYRDWPVNVRLRAVLKRLLRSHGFTCEAIKELG